MEIGTILTILIVATVFFLLGRLVAEIKFKQRETEARQDAVKRSRAVIGGQFSEQLAPYLPDFPYKPTEVKFLGKPTDFIVFQGLDDKSVEKVVFVEVKSGKASLSKAERSLKSTIQKGKVEFETYRVPEGVTSGKT